MSFAIADGLNLHHDADVEALALELEREPEGGSCALLISGQDGEGRRYFVERAVDRLREKGLRPLYAVLDLDGYEPERADPAAYAKHAAAKRGRTLDAADEGWIRRLVRGPRPSVHDFLAAAIVAGQESDAAPVRQRLSDAFAATDPWTALAESLAEGERLILQVADTAELPAVVRELLLELTAAHPRVKTLISCRPDDGLGKLVRGRENLRFEVMPLDPGEIRSLVEESLSDPGLPESFYDELVEETAGVRGALAAALKRRAELGQLVQSDDGQWRLAEVDGHVAANPSALLAEAGAALEEDEAKLLTSFVSLAALCGDNIPVRELLEYLGVEPGEMDDWIDRLDETVGADSEHALFAERFTHPSLPGKTVYGFARGDFPLRLRRGLSSQATARLAGELMRFLGQRFTVGSRAAARFYVELSRWAEATEQRLELERELAWWVGPDELEAMQQILKAELASGQRTALAVWTTINTVQFGWPAERTLALLHAIQSQELPPQLRGAHGAIRAGLLLEAGRNDEALQAAEEGLEHAGQDRLLESALWERMGRAYLAMGREEEARDPFARCGELQEKMLDEGDARVAPWIQAYTRTLRASGREEEAARLEGKLARLQKS
ncbi:MAG: tetratricopeptide repeat protein [Bryobacterales bacterium]|nr:tetratricopeptide repeat protein [Bryobacterales bacterium]